MLRVGKEFPANLPWWYILVWFPSTLTDSDVVFATQGSSQNEATGAVAIASYLAINKRLWSGVCGLSEQGISSSPMLEVIIGSFPVDATTCARWE